MIKQAKLTVIFALMLMLLGTFSAPALADEKSEQEPSKGKTVEKAAASDKIADILAHYFAIRDLLAHDKTDGAAKHAQEMSDRLGSLIKALDEMQNASKALEFDDLKAAREGFGPLSEAVLTYVKKFGFSGDAYSFHCDMVKRSWLQEHDQIGNPYYGSEMYKCGDLTGMTVNGKFVEKSAGESEHQMHMKEKEGN